MDYSKGYMQARNLADQIVESAPSGTRVRAGLGSKSRPTNRETIVQDSLTDIEQLNAAYMASFRDTFGDAAVDEDKKGMENVKPVTAMKGLGGGALEGDLEFMDAVERLEEKFPGLNRRELFRIINGESKFDPTVINKHNMAGLFQLSPDAAKELGTSKEAIVKMSPGEQVDLYGSYLEKWGWHEGIPLAVMQAAPSLARELDNPDDVVYSVNSAAWKANPGWRSAGDGAVTLKSLKDYYGG